MYKISTTIYYTKDSYARYCLSRLCLHLCENHADNMVSLMNLTSFNTPFHDFCTIVAKTGKTINKKTIK